MFDHVAHENGVESLAEVGGGGSVDAFEIKALGVVVGAEFFVDFNADGVRSDLADNAVFPAVFAVDVRRVFARADIHDAPAAEIVADEIIARWEVERLDSGEERLQLFTGGGVARVVGVSGPVEHGYPYASAFSSPSPSQGKGRNEDFLRYGR